MLDIFSSFLSFELCADIINAIYSSAHHGVSTTKTEPSP